MLCQYSDTIVSKYMSLMSLLKMDSSIEKNYTIVQPIPKNSDVESVKNYCPIAYSC